METVKRKTVSTNHFRKSHSFYGERLLLLEAIRFVKVIFFSGHLKRLGTQMGYPIGVLIWMVVENNDQTIFRSILLSRRCQPGLPN